MYESPINQVMSKISSEMKECEDNQLMCEIRQTIGYDIDKTELVKALRYDREQYEKGYADGLNANRWIPCGERLPEENKKVIVSDVFGVYIGEFIDAEESWGVKHFINEHGMHSKSAKAWMPLPKPYKESEDGEK